MRLLSAPITSLSWQDVTDFCSLDLPESTTLDYKRDIPSDLDRTVAAMANTSGGVILIGVDEDRTSTKPIMPPIGVQIVRGLPERITNLCIANLAPPMVPEIAMIEEASGNSAVIVVRVPQSHQAPHAVSRNTKVYLRRGGTNSPEDIATLDELEWLKAGRQQSIDFRKALYGRAQGRFFQFLRGYDGSNTKPPRVERDGMLSLSFCPTYPKDMLSQPPALHEVLRNIRVRDYYGTDHEFPLGSLNGVIVQDGYIVHASINGGDWVHHTELNSFGLLFFKQSLLHPVKQGNSEYRVMRASEIFSRLDEMFDCAIKFYERIGYNGSLEFQMYLENLIGFPFGKYIHEGTAFELSYTPDASVDFSATLRSSNFIEEKSQLILEAARRVAWAFDWDVDSNLMNKYYAS